MKRLYYLKYALLFFILVAGLNESIAGHVLGTHIGYKRIDSVTYEVTLTMYRDCNGIALTAPTLTVTGRPAGPYTTVATKVSSTDVTGAYLNCAFTSRCTGSYPYGIEESVYKDTVDISGGLCDFVFSYSECCRPLNVTTGGAGDNIYNEATVNKCLGNNSVQADLKPFFLIPVGQDASLTTFVGDRSSDGDSVVYSLVDALLGPASKITYGGSHTGAKPLTFLGFPNSGLAEPAGFHFDRKTSEMRFRPTKANEVATICVEAKEFRKINGIMEVTGVTRMDYIVIVVNSPGNRVPAIQGKNALACSGQKTCITIETSDGDAFDSTFLDLHYLPSGATVTYGFKGKNATAEVCWTPTLSDVRNNPYIFFASVSDNTCLIAGRATRIFTYNVFKAPDSTDYEIVSKTPQCSSAEIVVNVKNTNAIKGFKMMDEDSISSDTLPTSRLYFKGSGWKKFHITFYSKSSCDYVFTDSVFISPQYSLQLNTKSDSAICPYDSVNIYTQSVSGTAPFTYSWGSLSNNAINAQTASFTTLLDDNMSFKVFVKDNNNCIALDTVKIALNPIPYIDAGLKDTVCPLVPFTLSAVPDSGVQVSKYDWKGLDTLQTVTTQINDSNFHWYFVTATNQQGCVHTDSIQIDLFPIGVDAGTYPAVCAGTALQIKATSTAGAAPFTYNWVNTSINTSVVNIVPNNDTAIVVRIQDTLGCFAYDTAYIIANPLPTFIAPPNTNICKGQFVTWRVDSIKGTAPYIIRWNGVIAPSPYTFTPQQTTNVTIIVTDDNLCATAQTVQLTVFNNPAVNLGLDRTVCKETQVSLNAFVVGGAQPFTYLWSDGSKGTGITKTVSTPQQYFVEVTDDNGCIGRDTIQFSVFPTQKAILPVIGTICESDPPIGLKAIPNTGTWSGSGVNTNIFVPQLAQKGQQYIKYEFLSVDNCPEKDSLFVNVKKIPIPNFKANKTEAKPGVQINFTNQTVADTAYSSVWDMGDTASTGNIITTQHASYVYNTDGRYTVKLSVFNGVCPLQTIEKTKYILIDKSLSVSSIKNNLVSIYPNPSNGDLTIDAETPFTTMEVFDILGKKVWEKEIAGSMNAQIGLTHLAAGTYTLKLGFANGTSAHSTFIIAK